MDDRAIVAAMLSGEPHGLENAYRRYADQLRAYCVSLLGDGDAAADAVHDTFMLAGERIGQLRDPDRLRPWLYAIARHECLRHRRRRARLTALDDAGDPAADTVDLTAAVHTDQVRELIHAAAAGLPDSDRDLIELALRHGLSTAEVAAVLGVSANHAHARLSRARGRLEAAIGVLVVARAGRSACPGLAGLLDGWSGRLDPLLRKRLSRHVDRCRACSDRRGQLVHPAALLAAFAAGPALGAAGTWWFGTPGADPGAEPGGWGGDPGAWGSDVDRGGAGTGPGGTGPGGAGPGGAGPGGAGPGGAGPGGPGAGGPGTGGPGTGGTGAHPGGWHGRGDPPDAPPETHAAPPRRRSGYRAAAGVAAAVLVFAAIAVALTRVTDPAALAGQQDRPVAAPAGSPSRTADPAPLATSEAPAFQPEDGGSSSESGEDDDTPRSPGTSTADQDVTNGDLDRAPDPFEVDVVRFSVGCAADGRTYVLSVRVRGNHPVRSATVYWRTSPSAAPDHLDLGLVDRVTREGSRGGLRLPTIEWWVEGTDVSGTEATTDRRTATNPCH